MKRLTTETSFSGTDFILSLFPGEKSFHICLDSLFGERGVTGKITDFRGEGRDDLFAQWSVEMNYGNTERKVGRKSRAGYLSW